MDWMNAHPMLTFLGTMTLTLATLAFCISRNAKK